jgi:hypothetical protein
MQQCIRILLFHIYMKLNMFRGKHTAHHQEPKTALAASGFLYVKSCRMCSCWTLAGSVRFLPQYHAKPEAAFAVSGS